MPAVFNRKSEDIKVKNILTELYYGNVDPQARGFKKNSYLQKQMSILSDCETYLTEKLEGEEKKSFLSFVNASNVVLGEYRSLTASLSDSDLEHVLSTISSSITHLRMRTFLRR